ncbi:MAG TPA: tetratricopeptide repeat protein, partial [Ktedonobacterales bacterium]|nr:tetratricopeptide repeat protein [Ktedonobacterales bacterium]
TDSLREDGLPEQLAALRNGSGESQSGPLSAQPTGNGSQVLTLENIEQQFAASGFQSFEPRPGALADLAEGGATAGNAVTGHPAPSPSTSTVPQPAGPAPDDYPARLALARQRREEGNLDEAMVEYRAVLKNAPDLFSEVLEDLRAIVATAPEHPELHRLLGDAYIRQGDYLNALESYNRALALSQAQEQ